MRLVKILALTLALILPWLASPSAEATDLRFRAGIPDRPSAPPPARTPSVLRGGDPKISHFDRDRPGHFRRFHGHHNTVGVFPSTVFLSPGQCWQPGYWTYQWAPQSYTSSTWVPGQWSPDGRWMDGHYAPSLYNTGYYQPLWVEGYWTTC